MFRRKNTADRAHRHVRAADFTIPGTEEPERDELEHPKGPWDVEDVQLDEDDPSLVDLGGLVVRGRPGLEMRLQVDERTQDVVAVMLVSEDGAVELRAFAAPRSESIWDDVRREIGAEAARRGGTATNRQGDFGTEVELVVHLRDGDALITRARADLVSLFLDDPAATHLLFVDADIGFEPDQVMRLIACGADVAGGADHRWATATACEGAPNRSHGAAPRDPGGVPRRLTSSPS